MKISKLILILITFVLVLPVFGNEQEEFEKWLAAKKKGQQKQAQEFKDFMTQRDKEFKGFLEKRWKEFEAYSGIKLYKDPKPVKLPEIKPTAPPKVVPPPPAPEPVPVKKPIILTPIKPPKPEETNINVDFYGQKAKVKIPNGLREIKLNSGVSNKVFSSNWELMASKIDSSFLKDLNDLRNYMAINDWGYAQLLATLLEQLNKDKNTTNQLMWFLMVKSGLNVKLGYVNQTSVVMINPSNIIYETSYFRIGKKKERFYPIVNFFDSSKNNIKSLKTYDADYPEKLNSLDLKLRRMPNFPQNLVNRNISFKYATKDYSMKLTLNKNLLDFMASLPVSEFEVAYTAGESPEFKANLLSTLSEMIKPLSNPDKVTFLLNFVQTFTGYKTDQDNFGKELYLFPDQVLYFPYSDCDDRVSLFSSLIRELTNFKIAYLLYPDHIAAAVSLPNGKGDSINYKGRKYFVADPTYIGAGIGMTMPKYKSTNPKIFSY